MKVDVSREEVTVKYTWFKSRAEQKVTSHILKTGNFGGSFASVLEANVFVTKAKDALVNLKKIIESQSAKPESESFEL